MNYLDASQYNVFNLVSDMQRTQEVNEMLDLVSKLGAVFSQDGDQYCWLCGTPPNDCIIGFGDTPSKALQNFHNNFYTQKAIKK